MAAWQGRYVVIAAGALLLLGLRYCCRPRFINHDYLHATATFPSIDELPGPTRATADYRRPREESRLIF